jgi:hypothetical protein
MIGYDAERESFTGKHLRSFNLKSKEGGGKVKLRCIFQMLCAKIRSGLNWYRSRPDKCFALPGLKEDMVRFSHKKERQNFGLTSRLLKNLLVLLHYFALHSVEQRLIYTSLGFLSFAPVFQHEIDKLCSILEHTNRLL